MRHRARQTRQGRWRRPEYRRARESGGPGRALTVRRRREPARVPRAVSRPERRGLPVSRSGDEGSGLRVDQRRQASPPDAAHHAQSRLLRRLALRDRALARRQGRGVRCQRVHRVSGGTAARAGLRCCRRADRGRRSRGGVQRRTISLRKSRRSPRERGGCSRKRGVSGSASHPTTHRSSRWA